MIMTRSILKALAAMLLLLVASGSLASLAKAESAGQDLGDYEALISDAKAKMLVDPAQAIARAKVAERSAKRLYGEAGVVGVATAQWLQAEGYIRLNNTDTAAPLIDHALSLVSGRAESTKLFGDMLLSRGGLMTAKADVAGALSAYQKAYEVFRKIGEVRSQSIAVVSIGILYQEADNYKNALKYYGDALDIYRGDSQILFSIYSNRGICLQELRRIDEARAEYVKALEIARALKSSILQARTLRNIARSELLVGQIDAADEAIEKGFRSVNAADAGAARNHFLVLSAWSARLHGHLPAAERLIERAFESVDTTTSTLDLREGHQIAYDIYKEAGNQTKALAHLEALKRFDDKTSKLAASANTALAAARFDFANQELKIEKLKRAQLQRNIDDARERARTQQLIFGGAALVTVLIVSMLAFGLVTIGRSRNQVRAANVDLANTNAALGRALAAKTEFLATTSHEIRTPLNGILGMTQVMLADRELSAPLRDRIGVVHSAGVSMRTLVDDILDVAKMETGNLTIEHISFNLREMMGDVSKLWQEQARGKGVSFVLDLESCPANIVGDPARLRQIVFNLLSNALKFTANGCVTLCGAAEGGTLNITVSDTGIGIPSDKLGLVFESFRQVDAGTTRKYGGTGLGLTICQNLAKAMGGRISVTSELGAGATFTVSLPLVGADDRDAAAAAPEGGPDALLIVDRNPISRSMLRAVLESRGGPVEFAGTVEEAIARIALGGIKRVLIDDATLKCASDLSAALRALGDSGAWSALLWPSPDSTDCAQFAAAGIDRVIAKPIGGAALVAAVFDAPALDRTGTQPLVTQAA